jgi:hypothetical protein
MAVPPISSLQVEWLEQQTRTMHYKYFHIGM